MIAQNKSLYKGCLVLTCWVERIICVPPKYQDSIILKIKDKLMLEGLWVNDLVKRGFVRQSMVAFSHAKLESYVKQMCVVSLSPTSVFKEMNLKFIDTIFRKF